MKQCASGHKRNTQTRQSTRPHLTLETMTKHIMIHRQHRISAVILRGLSCLARSLGSALHDENPILWIHTAFNILSQNWFQMKKTFNFERFESTLTVKSVNSSWWLWNPEDSSIRSMPRLRLATKGFLHMSSSLCQFRQEILTSKQTKNPGISLPFRILWEKRLNKLDTVQVGMDLPFL